MILDHLAHLRPNVIRAIYRDTNACEESQRERNNYLCRSRLKSWLYDHGMDSRTGLPHTGRPAKTKRKVA